jgi:hypothetical protein
MPAMGLGRAFYRLKMETMSMRGAWGISLTGARAKSTTALVSPWAAGEVACRGAPGRHGVGLLGQQWRC